jgi:HEAT repeat protein
MRSIIFDVICAVALGGAVAWSAPLPEGLVKALGSEDLKERYTAQQELWSMAAKAGAPGHDAASAKALEEALLALARDGEASLPARLAALRPFESIGGADAVAGLASLLDDPSPEVREAARVGLEMSPSPDASKPLREALAKSRDARWTIGLVDALMHRRDAASIPLFRDLLGRADTGVVRLAAQALGILGGAEAVQALRDALPRLEGREKSVAQSAMIRAGASPEVVEALWPGAANAAVRCEIFNALLVADESAAARIVAAVLSAPELPGAAQILREAVRSGRPALADAAIKAEAELPLPVRLAVLGALSDAGDTRPASSLAALVESADARYRPALIALLGGSGSEVQVPLLLGLADDRSPEVASAASVALARLRRQGLDERLLALAQAGQEPDRLAAIRLAAHRNPPGTEDVLGRLVAEDPSAEVREAALASLGVVGGIATANLFLTRIAAAPDAGAARPFQAEFRRMAPRLLSVPVLWREGFLPAYEAAKSTENRVALLMMVAALRGPDAGKFLVTTAQGPDGPERAEALKQLAGWTHTDAGPFLLDLAAAPGIDEKTRESVFSSLTRLFFPTSGGGKGAQRDLAPKVLAAAPDEATRQRIQQAIDDSGVLEKKED